MKTIDQLTPLLATHPGEIIGDELEAINMSQASFAKLIGLKRSQLNEIIKGKRNINAELSLLLEKTLGIDAEYWMEAQKNYDLDHARILARENKRLQAIEQYKFIEDKVAITFLKKEKILSGDPIEDIKKIKNIYQVKHFEQFANINVQKAFVRFRKSSKLKIDPVNIIGWSKLVQFKARNIHIKPFEHDKKGELIIKLKLIIKENIDTKDRIQNLLKDYGIKLIYQTKGEKTPVDGISFWSNGNPAIGMSIRHKRIDNYAFTLFHELGHVYEHLINNNEAEFIDLDPSKEEKNYKNSVEEKEADRFAEKNLISDEDWNSYCDEYSEDLFNDLTIETYSKKINIHPAILKGRLCFKYNNYKIKSTIDNKIH